MASNNKLIRIIMELDDRYSQKMKHAEAATKRVADRMRSIGTGLAMGVTAPLAIAGAAAVKTAIDFEASFAQVEKSVDGTDEQLSHLNNELRRLATETPLGALENAHRELDRIAAAAGRLGVDVEHIPKFTEAVAALSVAADGLDAETAAEQIARFANVTGMSLQDVNKLADVIAHLGNNFATTEVDILNFGQRMSTLSAFGFAEDEILAIGTAMSAMGVSAELGSTNFVKAIADLTASAARGGKEAEAFTELLIESGFTAEQAADALAGNGGMSQAVMTLSAQLRNMSTQDALLMLEELGITGTEAQRVFLSLAEGSETLYNALDQAGIAFEGNMAALREAEAIAATTQGQLRILWANLQLLGDALGRTVLPMINAFAQALIPVIQWIANAPPWVQRFIVILAALAASIGPLIIAIGNLMSAWAAITAAMTAVSAVSLPALIAGFVALAGPILVVVAAFGTIAAAAWLLRDRLQWLVTGVDLVIMGLSTIPERLRGVGFAIQAIGIQIKTAWNNINWRQMGQAIIVGMMNGINSMARKLVSQVQRLVNSINSTVRRGFGIRSPSTVFEKFGRQVVQGFDKGVSKGLTVPAVSMPPGGSMPTSHRAISSSLSGRTGGSTGTAARLAGAAGGVLITGDIIFQMPPGTDRENMEYINRELGRLAKRRGAR